MNINIIDLSVERNRIADTVASLLNTEAHTEENIFAACELACQDTTLTANEVYPDMLQRFERSQDELASGMANFNRNRSVSVLAEPQYSELRSAA